MASPNPKEAAVPVADNIPEKRDEKNHEDAKTDCSTPFSSPERLAAATSAPGTGSRTGSLDGTADAGADADADADADAASTTTQSRTQAQHKKEGDGCKTKTSSKAAGAASTDNEISYKNWPMAGIKEPSINDVLFGRGGGTNHHEGNKRYRKLVEKRKMDYVNSKRLDKPLVALDIIRGWREQKPPGRFLKLDDKTGMWEDVGDKKAREKTSQALREKAPMLRKQQEEILSEQVQPIRLRGVGSSSGSPIEQPKTTRFNVPPGAGKPSRTIKRSMLARDHSLGRDFIAADEPISIKGFSWDAADKAIDKIQSHDVINNASSSPPGIPQPHSWHGHDNRMPPPQQYPYSNYGQSQGYGHTSQHQPSSTGSGGPSLSSLDRQHSLAVNPLPGASTSIAASNSFTEGYNSNPSTPRHGHGRSNGPGQGHGTSNWQNHSYPHPPSTPHSDERLQAEWAKRRYNHGGEDKSGNNNSYRHSRSAESEYRSHSHFYPTSHPNSGSHGQGPAPGPSPVRSGHQYPNQNPNPNSFGPPAPGNMDTRYTNRWDGYNGYPYTQQGSGLDSSMMPPPTSYNPHGDLEWTSPPRSGASVSGPGSGPYPEQPQVSPPGHSGGHGHGHPAIHGGYGYGAAAGIGGYLGVTGVNSNISNKRSSDNDYGSESSSLTGGSPSRSIPRPQCIKRDTSHQCETGETKGSIKRMNRQRSLGKRDGILNEVTETEMKNLRTHMRQSSIGEVGYSGVDEYNDNHDGQYHGYDHPLKRPSSLTDDDRKLTIDGFDLGIDAASSPLDGNIVTAMQDPSLSKPLPLGFGGGQRESSVASIKIDDIAGLIQESNAVDSPLLARPSTLNDSDRGDTLGSLNLDSDLHQIEEI